jgi:hypothetical protein
LESLFDDVLAYADAMDTVVSTSYDIFNRKFFSLPKLLLLPGVIMKQPIMLAKIFPFIFITDVLKARLVAVMTSEIERTERESNEVRTYRFVFQINLITFLVIVLFLSRMSIGIL